MGNFFCFAKNAEHSSSPVSSVDIEEIEMVKFLIAEFLDAYDDNAANSLYFDETTRLHLYSTSSPGAFPGDYQFENNDGEILFAEKMPPEKRQEFAHLHTKFPLWRNMLSNFWTRSSDGEGIVKHPVAWSPLSAKDHLFELDGKKWASQEHYFHANIFTKHADFMDQFAVDSGTALSKSPSIAKQCSRGDWAFLRDRRWKNYRKEHSILRDEDFHQRSKNVMILACFAKFSQNPLLAEMLLATRDARLMHCWFKAGGEMELTSPLELIFVRHYLQRKMREGGDVPAS